jgi:hypothetical protein
MTQYEAVVEYAGKRVKVKSDSFEELHTALAGIEELNHDAAFLRREKSVEDVIPVHRRDEDENDYYGLQDRHSRKNVTYGKKRGESVIPFFPKGADGYYDPGAMGPRRSTESSNESRNGSRRSPKENGEQRAQERSAERRHAERRRDERVETTPEATPATTPAASDDLQF